MSVRPNFMAMDETLWTPEEQVEGARRRMNFMKAAGVCAPTLLMISVANDLVKRLLDEGKK